MNFQNRLHTSEQLDNLALSGNVLSKTLGSLKLINTLFGMHRQLANAILRYCKSHPEKKTFHIVDIGCGGGDSIHYIAKKLARNSIQATFLGIDGNPKSVDYANALYAHTDAIEFIADDILSNQFHIPSCDLLISSHFMYHFRDTELLNFLNKIAQKDIQCFIFSELIRSKIAYILFTSSSFLLPISNMAKKDGLLAIQRAFTYAELEAIIEKSTLKNFSIKKKPWFRTLTQIEF